MDHIKIVGKNMKEIDSLAEAYLELSRTFTMKYFCKNIYWTKAVNYFHKKNSIVDFRLGSKYASVQYELWICEAKSPAKAFVLS